MALKTLRFVQGLSRTPLLFSSISHNHISQTYFPKTINLENRKSENMKIQKPRFTNKCPEKEVRGLRLLHKPLLRDLAPSCRRI